MAKEIKFSEFIRESNIQQQYLDYNDLTPKPQFDAEGQEKPYTPPKIKLRAIDVHRLLTPYVRGCPKRVIFARAFDRRSF